MNWYGATPKHWDERRIGSLLKQRKEKNDPIQTSFILSLSSAHGVVPYAERQEKGGNKPKSDLSKYMVANVDDLLVNCMNVLSGSSGVSKWHGAISPVYYALYPQQVDNVTIWFYNYIFRSPVFYRSLIRLGRGILMYESSSGAWNTIRLRISMQDLNNVFVPHPPIDEQEQVVRWLNWQTYHIQKFLSANQRKIECLKELKKSLICETTTVGLKPNKEMKIIDTYFEHAVPHHWREVKLKRILQKLVRAYSADAEILICSNKGTVFPRGDSEIGLVSESESFYQGVCNGDLLIHGMDTWHGAIAVSELDGKCTGVVHVCSSEQNKMFIAYYLQMLAFRKLYKAITNGVRQNTSDFRSWEKAGEILIMLPPKKEQDAIAAFLNEKCTAIDQLITKITKEISLVNEYHTRIISDAVTGKIDLRGVEVPEYINEEDDLSIDETPEMEDEASVDD